MGTACSSLRDRGSTRSTNRGVLSLVDRTMGIDGIENLNSLTYANVNVITMDGLRDCNIPCYALRDDRH